MGKERILKYDNAKFLLILFVVTGHLIDYFSKNCDYHIYRVVITFIYSFHMPVFIFLSGLFYKCKDNGRKAFQYFSIGLLLRITLYITYRCLGSAAGMNLFFENGVPWYMYAIATYYLVLYVFRNVNQKTLLVMGLIFSLCVGYIESVGDFLVLSRCIVFFPFFLLGAMTNREKLLKVTSNKALKAGCGVLLAAWFVFIYFKLDMMKLIMPMFTGRNHYYKLDEALQPYGVGVRALCYVISFVIGFAVICIVPNVKIPAITKFGSRTLQVYFWHSTVIYTIIYFGVADALSPSRAGRIAYISLAIVITLVLSLKPFEYPASLIMKYSAKEN